MVKTWKLGLSWSAIFSVIVYLVEKINVILQSGEGLEDQLSFHLKMAVMRHWRDRNRAQNIGVCWQNRSKNLEGQVVDIS